MVIALGYAPSTNHVDPLPASRVPGPIHDRRGGMDRRRQKRERAFLERQIAHDLANTADPGAAATQTERHVGTEVRGLLQVLEAGPSKDGSSIG